MRTIFKSTLIIVLSVMILVGCKDPIPEVVITTDKVSGITTTTAKINGSFSSAENTNIIEFGLCWSLTPNPEVSDNHIASDSINKPFSYLLTDLQPETEYHVRAYAYDGLKYYYGEDVCFTTQPKGLFSVSRGTKVRFSKGNLQYNASSNTWRFAEHQWDIVGCSEPNSNGFVFGTVDGNSNHLIGPDYNGWIDLFGWGTNGIDNGAVCYQPWSTSTNNTDYYFHNLSGGDINADWGANPISNGGNQAGTWRTLSIREWDYLFYQRQTASGLVFVDAMVNGIRGIILLPDDWDNTIYQLIYEPYSYINRISSEQWELLESNGVVFLPSTGERNGTTVTNSWSGGYWSSTSQMWLFNNTPGFSAFLQVSNGMRYIAEADKHTGLSVRLVQDYPFNNSTSSTPTSIP